MFMMPATKSAAGKRERKSLEDFPGVAFFEREFTGIVDDLQKTIETERARAASWIDEARSILEQFEANPNFTSEYNGLSPEVNGEIMDDLREFIETADARLAEIS